MVAPGRRRIRRLVMIRPQNEIACCEQHLARLLILADLGPSRFHDQIVIPIGNIEESKATFVGDSLPIQDAPQFIAVQNYDIGKRGFLTARDLQIAIEGMALLLPVTRMKNCRICG